MSSPPPPPAEHEEAEGDGGVVVGEENARDPEANPPGSSEDGSESTADSDYDDDDDYEEEDSDDSEDDGSDEERAGDRGSTAAAAVEALAVALEDLDAQSPVASCCVCMEPWTSDGPHRVCCVPCGHVYGRSCLEAWLRRRGGSSAKCPQCGQRYKQKHIINLYTTEHLWTDCYHHDLCSTMVGQLKEIGSEVKQLLEFKKKINLLGQQMKTMMDDPQPSTFEQIVKFMTQNFPSILESQK